MKSANATTILCSKKIILTLTVVDQTEVATSMLSFNVSCINSPTGQCPCPCNYVQEAACGCRDLSDPMTVQITKSAAYLRYPLQYSKTFEGKPEEGIILTNSCSDSEYDRGATCGFAGPDPTVAYDDVPDSQGFCCECPQSVIDLSRANLNCDNGPKQSAHCLRFDQNWRYHGYTLGAPSMDFSIDVGIRFSRDESSAFETLRLDPSRQIRVDSTKSVRVELMGDISGYQSPPALSGSYLMVPVPPGPPDPNAALSDNLEDWMIVPPYMVTLDGSECDKIGVGYSAFRLHGIGGGCGFVYGSCLQNQLFNLVMEDAERLRNREIPLFNVSRYWNLNTGTMQNVASASGGSGMVLRLPTVGKATSLVSLQVKADDVALIISSSPAEIVSVTVCSGAFCQGSFEALSGAGILMVSVKNSGYLDAEYEVGLSDCDLDVIQPPADQSAISAQHIRDFIFPLDMSTDAAGNWTCSIIVTDVATGSVAAVQSFTFSTTATIYDPPPYQSPIDDDLQGPGDPPTFYSCKQQCTDLFNFKCAFLKGCWSRLWEALGALMAILAVMALLIVAVRRGWISLLLKKIFKQHSKREQYQTHMEINKAPRDNFTPGQREELISAVRLAIYNDTLHRTS